MKEVRILFTKTDKTLLDNLIRIIGRVKIELEGAEILLASDSMRFLVRLQKQIEEEAKRPDIEIKEAPITEPTPAKPEKKTRKKKGAE